ncbi:hypothetical protein Rin_00017730 [Candidatus Regiella insecticola 5.15]|uniref:Uncharacterized protein n=1 Tax=Candidatus Regiella insecticola 5.15 TaxID=1005043 RepID=G2H138_9ENTR|nr:hypothetical protein [Candidatus Regiella insecticola]EGY28281.1 hypothetical protein Rin_00017730 [Candidatus Regiella insecticola 5.15]
MMKLQLENLDNMTSAQENVFMTLFGDELACDDGAESRKHLSAGEPVYYRQQDTPAGMIIKEYPAGRKELVSFVTGVERFVEIIAV